MIQEEGMLSENDRAHLRQQLSMAFSHEELKTLCFDLGENYENIARDTKDGTTREIVLRFERLARITDLIQYYARHKAKADQQKRIPPNTDSILPRPMNLASPFRYDAFVSYANHAPFDADWVWQTLVPKATAAGLRMAVSGDVEEVGVVAVVAKEIGIQQAKRVLVVLSPAYLADHMADFENMLAQSISVQEGSYRLLPVKIAPLSESELPARLAMLITLDMISKGSIERSWQRLLNALADDLPRRK